MGDTINRPAAGPDGMFDTAAPPSRGQMSTIAHLAGELLGFGLASRYDASVAIVRLRAALLEQPVKPPPGGAF